MSATRVAWLAVAALAVGCSGSGGGNGMNNNNIPGPMRPSGFNPPLPEAGEIELDSPIIPAIAPGTDVTYCSYLDATITDETDVVRFRGVQSMPGHHAILYAAKQTRPVDTHVCTEDDMINSRFIAAAPGEGVGKLEIPDGLAFRIPAGTQLMIQTHWINATMHPADGQAVIYLTEQPSSPSRQVLDLFNVVLTNFTIPAGKTVTASTTCTMKQDVQLFTITGHQHEFGSHVNILLDDGGNATSLWNNDWLPQYQSTPPETIYSVAQPLVLKAGQKMTVTCSWNNPGAVDLAFPREMCVGSGFYFPAVKGEIDCVDGNWGG